MGIVRSAVVVVREGVVASWYDWKSKALALMYVFVSGFQAGIIQLSMRHMSLTSFARRFTFFCGLKLGCQPILRM